MSFAATRCMPLRNGELVSAPLVMRAPMGLPVTRSFAPRRTAGLKYLYCPFLMYSRASVPHSTRPQSSVPWTRMSTIQPCAGAPCVGIDPSCAGISLACSKSIGMCSGCALKFRTISSNVCAFISNGPDECPRNRPCFAS